MAVGVGLGLLLAPVCLNTALSQDGHSSTGRRPMVVMKQEVIKGRVFFVSEDESEQQPASGLRIELRALGEDEVIATTVTDIEGRYKLENLDVGEYDLSVGLLRMELRVRDPLENPEELQRLPKTILIFIPRTLDTERG